MCADIRLLLHWYLPTEGGRQLIPVGLDYRAAARIGDDQRFWVIQLLMPQTAWKWGQSASVEARFLVREDVDPLLQEGSIMYIYEGARIVAEGIIERISPKTDT